MVFQHSILLEDEPEGYSSDLPRAPPTDNIDKTRYSRYHAHHSEEEGEDAKEDEQMEDEEPRQRYHPPITPPSSPDISSLSLVREAQHPHQHHHHRVGTRKSPSPGAKKRRKQTVQSRSKVDLRGPVHARISAEESAFNEQQRREVDALALGLDPDANAEQGPDAIDLDQKRTVPLQFVDWSKVEELEPITSPNYCFLCLFAQSKAQYMLDHNKHLEKMLIFYRENYSHIDPVVFARTIQQRFYNPSIRPYLKKNGVRYVGKAWSMKNIYEHGHKHVLKPLFIRERALRVFTEYLNCLEENGIFMEDGRKQRSTDRVKMFEYVRVWKEVVAPLLQDGFGTPA